MHKRWTYEVLGCLAHRHALGRNRPHPPRSPRFLLLRVSPKNRKKRHQADGWKLAYANTAGGNFQTLLSVPLRAHP